MFKVQKETCDVPPPWLSTNLEGADKKRSTVQGCGHNLDMTAMIPSDDFAHYLEEHRARFPVFYDKDMPNSKLATDFMTDVSNKH